jgi:transposase-like protein
MSNPTMISNIEPLAREMAERICRKSGMAESQISNWVDQHWQCAAAMMEAGVMDENGEWVEEKDVRVGLEAYHDRLRLTR